jgi:hypothetical protein
MFQLSQNIQEFLQEFRELLVLIAKCLKSKIDERDYQNSTKTERHVTEKMKLEIKASLQSPVYEREANLKSTHSIEHVKEKGEGSSLEIKLLKM